AQTMRAEGEESFRRYPESPQSRDQLIVPPFRRLLCSRIVAFTVRRSPFAVHRSEGAPHQSVAKLKLISHPLCPLRLCGASPFPVSNVPRSSLEKPARIFQL